MKKILITGCSTGIGRDAALTLARRGFTVYAGVRKSPDIESLKSEKIETLIPIILDVLSDASVDEALAKIESLDAVVNNAGVVVAGPLEFLPLENIRNQFEVNVMGVFRVIQKTLPFLRKTKGRIINVGSISGRMTTPFVGPYSASKHALRSLTDALRVELSTWDIQVSLVEPGPIKTPIWEKSTHAAQTARTKLSPQAENFYGKTLDNVLKMVEDTTRRAAPVSKVTDAIVSAITSKHPRRYYAIGNMASLDRIAAQWMPSGILDVVLKKAMKIPKN